MLSETRFKDFKLLRDVRLPLGRLGVLVGPNGVGKSSVLEGLHDLLRLATPLVGEDELTTGRPGALFRGVRALRHLVAKPDASGLELEATLEDGRCFGVRGTPAPQGTRGSDAFHLWFGAPGQTAALDLPGKEDGHAVPFFNGPQEAKLASVIRLKLHSEALAADHYAEAEVPQMDHDGGGLASVLQYVQGLRDGTLEAIEQDLAAMVPGARRIRALPARVRRLEKQHISVEGQSFLTDQWHERTGARVEVEWEGLGWIPADQLSEGTLLTLGLITVARYRAPRLVLLDDMDKALHPVAQRKLVALLRKILETTPDLQIVATSHSPFVLDELDASEIFVLGPAGDRGSAARRLDEHPTWKKRGAYLRPGELWSLVGEGWVTEGAR